MASTTFRRPAADLGLALELTADNATVIVEAVPGLTEATVEISGPADAVRGTTEHVGQTWHITIPPSRSGSGRVTNTVIGGRGTIIQAGNINGGVVFAGGVNTVSGMVVNGVAVSGTETEPVRVLVQLPADSSFFGWVTAGQVRTTGRLKEVRVSGESVDVRVGNAYRVNTNISSGDVTVDRVTGAAVLSTVSGDLLVSSGSGADILNTNSGDIHYTAGRPGRVRARTSSGDVRINRAGLRLVVEADSLSGDVRLRG